MTHKGKDKYSRDCFDMLCGPGHHYRWTRQNRTGNPWNPRNASKRRRIMKRGARRAERRNHKIEDRKNLD